MNRVTRGTPSGAAYLDLQNQARRTGRPTRELLQLYALEGFLARLAVSDARETFVLKGGVLLAAFGLRRPTKDIDFAAIRLANDTETVLDLTRRVLVAEPPGSDGIEFAPDTPTAEVIREEENYSGVRVHIGARLAGARLPFHLDVNVGDPIWPAPTTISLPRLLGGPSITLPGYPMHMVHAEKIVTAIQRGTANTRWRDFGDIWSMSRRHPIGADELAAAIDTVARHRGATIRPLADVLDGFAEIAQTRWQQWHRRNTSNHRPQQFGPVLEAVIDFGDPVLIGSARGLAWHPDAATWG
ncbi:nucleotidyl transferase AbiEii/AbiGii toxin family protein [Millisia brevis]|uniref:nucleotidyl transferase AbiEii/AbiGii toxin family protein n=1 Tax=Millisia brevis TaxID=264148 RepID=UPI000830DC58|nr:nucleotidyl transferase AbiEii/AbiGii toxin family protein [Millisia brevis]